MIFIYGDQKREGGAEQDCVICQSTSPLGQLAAVSLYSDGRQALACSHHQPHNTRNWMLAWVAFETGQRHGERE